MTSRGGWCASLRAAALAILWSGAVAEPARAQQDRPAPTPHPAAVPADSAYAELAVQVTIDNGPSDVMVGVVRDSVLYLPLRPFLALVGLSVTESEPGVRLAGVLEPTRIRYLFDTEQGRVARGDSALSLAARSFVWRAGELFVSADLAAWAVGANASVSWTDLVVAVSGTGNLPVVVRMARDARRAALREPPPAVAPVAPAATARSILDGAALDWSLIGPTVRFGDGAALQLGAGLQVLGGSLEIQQQVAPGGPRFVGSPRASWTQAWPASWLVRQLRLGDLTGSGPEGLPVRGVLVTNAPFLRPAAFGLEALTGRLPAGWEAELYRGSQLIGYSAESAGRFALDLPVAYGPNPIDLVFYGTHGEILHAGRNILVPVDRLPGGRFEYALSGGACSVDWCEHAGNLDLRYGLSERVTMEAGVDVLSRSTVGTTAHPYGLVSAGLLPALGVTAQVVREGWARARADFDPSPDLTAGVEYVAFAQDTQALYAGRNQGRSRVALDFFWRPPLPGRALYFQGAWLRTAFDWGTAVLARGSATLNVGGLRLEAGARRQSNAPGDVVSGLDGSIATALLGPGRLLRSVLVHADARTTCSGELPGCPQVLSQVRVGVARRVARGLRADVSLSWQRGQSRPALELTLSGDLAGLRFSSQNAADPNSGVGGTQLLEGSLLWDRHRGRLVLGSGRSLGRAGIAGVVFFDANGNGVQDPGEPGLPDVLLRVGSQGLSTDSSGRFSVFELVPFEQTVIELDSLTLGDPTWVVAEGRVALRPSPNSYEFVRFAVVQGGEASGRVTWEGHERSVGGMRVVFREQQHGRETAVTTFNDGAFYVMGLRPGTYWVFVDNDQLEQLHLASVPVTIIIDPANHGEVEGITLRLDHTDR